MKTSRLILAALTLLAAMSTVSCEKETTIQPPEKKSYTLTLGEIPASFGEGEALTVTIPLMTDAPQADIVIFPTPDWIKASVSGTNLVLDIAANTTTDTRTANVVIGLKENGNKGTVKVVQDWILKKTKTAWLPSRIRPSKNQCS